MNSNNYIFNNEAIATVAIGSVFKNSREMTLAKAMLILPFLFHPNTLSALKDHRTVFRSLEEFIVKKPTSFVNFNGRFQMLLPVSINAIMILKEIGVISIKRSLIAYRGDIPFDVEQNNIGTRASNIIAGAAKLSKLLDEDVNTLYLKLKIEL